jgi:hypothetical protein
MDKDTSSLLTSRRSVVGGLGALAVAGEIDFAQAAQGPAAGKIYGVYTGKDMKSYMCVLTGGGPVPCYRLLISAPLPPPTWQDFHVSTYWGSVTMILSGQLEIGVTAGPLRSVLGKAGDVFVLIDTQGDGHSAARRGDVPLNQVNTRLKEPWLALSKSFKGWPDNVLPPKEYGPQINY